MIDEVIDHYRILELVGRGAMGVVYKALDLNIDRKVALKVMSAEARQDPDFVERFRQEARIQGALNHPNVALLFDYFVHDGTPVAVMEFIDGESLEQLIRRRGPIPAHEAIPIFQQALVGVAAAHRAGIIHRDLKAANLMITWGNVVKVMDFGIAKRQSGTGETKASTTVGSPLYMSPEQILGRPVDRRTDVYALGITLYQLLTGQLPFDPRGKTEYSLWSAHVNDMPEPPTVHVRDISPTLVDVVMRALAKDPNARFQSAEDFIRALPEVAPGNASASRPGPTDTIAGPRLGPTGTVATPRIGPTGTVATPRIGPTGTVATPRKGPTGTVATPRVGPTGTVVTPRTGPTGTVAGPRTGPTGTVATPRVGSTDSVVTPSTRPIGTVPTPRMGPTASVAIEVQPAMAATATPPDGQTRASVTDLDKPLPQTPSAAPRRSSNPPSALDQRPRTQRSALVAVLVVILVFGALVRHHAQRSQPVSRGASLATGAPEATFPHSAMTTQGPISTQSVTRPPAVSTPADRRASPAIAAPPAPDTAPPEITATVPDQAGLAGSWRGVYVDASGNQVLRIVSLRIGRVRADGGIEGRLQYEAASGSGECTLHPKGSTYLVGERRLQLSPESCSPHYPRELAVPLDFVGVNPGADTLKNGRIEAPTGEVIRVELKRVNELDKRSPDSTHPHPRPATFV